MTTERRLKLHDKLIEALGSKSVYWQPPENLKITYPCIIYEEHAKNPVRADNSDYLDQPEWDVSVIRTYKNREETSKILDRLKGSFLYCRRESHYVIDGMIHDTFVITY